MPPPQPAHGTTNRWRRGCHCRPCGDAHNADLAARRRRLLDAGPLGPKGRTRLIRLIRRGTTVVDAARAVGVSAPAVYGAAEILPDFRAALDEATEAARRCDDQSRGTAKGYRWLRCPCPDCRAYHREETRRYRQT